MVKMVVDWYDVFHFLVTRGYILMQIPFQLIEMWDDSVVMLFDPCLNHAF